VFFRVFRGQNSASDFMSASLPAATPHRAFSLGRVGALASNTILELVRLKIFYILMLFALGLILFSLVLVRQTFQEQFQILKDASLGAMSIFTWLLAVLATAMLLPKDIEDRTLYTILAKPVPRFEYLLGKLLGVMVLIFIATVLMSAMSAGVLRFWEGVVIAEKTATTAPEDLEHVLATVRASAFNANLIPGVLVIYVKAIVCATITLLISTFSSSWIFTVFLSTMVTMIGYVQATARAYWLGESATNVAAKVFAIFVALVFPDLQVFTLVDDIAIGTAVPTLLFVKAFGLGATYVVVYFFVAYIAFWMREL
jgi:hypothetical protein